MQKTRWVCKERERGSCGGSKEGNLWMKTSTKGMVHQVRQVFEIS